MTLGPRPILAHALSAIAGASLLVLAQMASAQEPAKTEGLERAQKAADAVFHWIKLNADKGASRQAPAPAPAPAPVARKPAPAPAPVAAAPKPAVTAQNNASAPAPALAAAPEPAPAPAAAPVVAVTVPDPEPERAPVLLASAAHTPSPAAPMAIAARAVEPPPKPAEEAEVPLRLLVKVEPTMPRQLQQQNLRTGYAQVQFTVEADGSVSQAQTLKASNARLGTAAVDAIKKWRFAPIPKSREAAVEVAFNNDN